MFHDPSSGTASRVFPKFQPGFSAATAADAEAEVKAGHAPETVEEEVMTAVVVVELDVRVVVDRVVLLVVLKVVAIAN